MPGKGGGDRRMSSQEDKWTKGPAAGSTGEGRVVGEAGPRVRGRSIKKESGVALESQEGKGRN